MELILKGYNFTKDQ